IMDNDFGFTAVDDPAAALPTIPTVDQIVTVQDIAEIKQELRSLGDNMGAIALQLVPKLNATEVDERLQAVENLILPLLHGISKNPDKEYLLWPKRQEQMQ